MYAHAKSDIFTTLCYRCDFCAWTSAIEAFPLELPEELLELLEPLEPIEATPLEELH